MLRLYMRHSVTGITVECENAVIFTNGTAKEWDLREATMTLVDAVAAEKGMTPIEVMAKWPVSTIVAKWEVD